MQPQVGVSVVHVAKVNKTFLPRPAPKPYPLAPQMATPAPRESKYFPFQHDLLLKWSIIIICHIRTNEVQSFNANDRDVQSRLDMN